MNAPYCSPDINRDKLEVANLEPYAHLGGGGGERILDNQMYEGERDGRS
jgi:hypothetical protein